MAKKNTSKKTKKELSTNVIPQEFIKQAMMISDQTNQQARLPLIRCDHTGQWGDAGNFVISDPEKRTEKNRPVYNPLGANFNGLILKIRSLVTSKGIKDEPAYYSYEQPRNQSLFDLYLNNDLIEEKQDYKALKSKYPNLIYNVVLYLYLADKRLARLKIKYPSTQQFWKYEREFTENKQPLMFFWTKFSSVKAPDASQQIQYFLLIFKKLQMAKDYKKVLDLAMEVDKELKELAESRKIQATQSSVEVLPNAPALAIPRVVDPAPEVYVPEYSEEDAMVEDAEQMIDDIFPPEEPKKKKSETARLKAMRTAKEEVENKIAKLKKRKGKKLKELIKKDFDKVSEVYMNILNLPEDRRTDEDRQYIADIDSATFYGWKEYPVIYKDYVNNPSRISLLK
ncbi:hypothetical protein CL633_04480 [bacterium]|nr:hypothetical protein [bacterium]